MRSTLCPQSCLPSSHSTCLSSVQSVALRLHLEVETLSKGKGCPRNERNPNSSGDGPEKGECAVLRASGSLLDIEVCRGGAGKWDSLLQSRLQLQCGPS